MIIVLGSVLRLATLFYPGFYEPDAYVYYAAITATINNHYAIPAVLPHLGFPTHVAYSEMPGLVYLTVVPYFFLNFMSLYILPCLANSCTPIVIYSAYTIMRQMPVFFGALGMIAVYFLSLKLIPKTKIAQLSMLAYAILPVAVWKTSALSYRGESFVPVMFAYLILLWLEVHTAIEKADYGIAVTCFLGCTALLGIIYFTWLGAVYIFAVIALALFYYGFKRELAEVCILGVIMGIVGFLLVLGSPSLSYLLHPNSVVATTTEGLPLSPIVLIASFSLGLIFAPVGLLRIKRYKVVSQGILYVLVATFLIGMAMAVLHTRWIYLLPIPLAIFTGIGIDWLGRKTSHRVNLFRIGIFIIPCLFVAILPQPIPLSTEAGGLGFLMNHTPSNATVLTFWQDGSFIEGWANRTTYTDSVEGGQNITRIQAFSDFLFAGAGNDTYLRQVNPDYIYVMRYWTANLSTFAIEGNISYPQYHGSNFWALESGGAPNVSLIYSDDNTLIYKVDSR